MSRTGRRKHIGGILSVLLVAAPCALAQGAEKRTIRGQVLDEKQVVVMSAVVYLINRTSKKQLSVVTDKEGRYQFNQLDRKADYQIYAESGKKRSRTRTISQLDPRTLIVVNLELEPTSSQEANKEGKDKN